MPSRNTGSEPRRIIRIQPKEVSLVDEGANLRELVIIKSKKGQEEMTIEITEEVKKQSSVIVATAQERLQALTNMVDTVKNKIDAAATGGKLSKEAVDEIDKAFEGKWRIMDALRTDVVSLAKSLGSDSNQPEETGLIMTAIAIDDTFNYVYTDELKKELADDLTGALDTASSFIHEIGNGVRVFPSSLEEAGTVKAGIEKAIAANIETPLKADLAVPVKHIMKFLEKVDSGEFETPTPTKKDLLGYIETTEDIKDKSELIKSFASADMDEDTQGAYVDFLAKAKKMTPARVEKLKTIATSITEFLKEVEPTSKPSVSSSTDEVATQKALLEQIQKSMKETVETALKPVNDSIEGIKKSAKENADAIKGIKTTAGISKSKTEDGGESNDDTGDGDGGSLFSGLV